MAPYEVRTGEVLFSDSQERLDLAFIHDFLCHRSYWAQGIPRETVEDSVRNSLGKPGCGQPTIFLQVRAKLGVNRQTLSMILR